MRNRVISVLVSFLFLMGVSSVSFCQQLLDKVVVIVNSHVITQSQVAQQMHIMQGEGANVQSSSSQRQNAIDQLIDEALELDLADKAKLKVTDAELDETIGKIAAQNHTTVDQMLKAISSHGLSEKAYRDQIRKQILIHKVEEKMLVPQVVVSKEDVAKAANMPQPKLEGAANPRAQYHVIDLLFASKESAEMALGKLQQLKVIGKTTDDAKKAFSNLQINNMTINDMGFRVLPLFPNIFIKEVGQLSPGQFSQPIDAPNGIHILFLASTAGKNVSMQAQQKMSPEQLAFQNKLITERQIWLRKLRAQSYVKVVG